MVDSAEYLLYGFIKFHNFYHLKANILRFAHVGNFLPILLSFVEKKLLNKGSIFLTHQVYSA